VTINEAEVPGQAEKYGRIGPEKLDRRCGEGVVWFSPEEFEEGTFHRSDIGDGPEYNGLKLDNNGNGFVVALGALSCTPGSSLIEADLEEKPFTTVTTNFLIESPKPTEY